MLQNYSFVIQDFFEALEIKSTSRINVTGQINITSATECAVVGCYEVFTAEQGFDLFHLFSPSCVLGMVQYIQ